MKPLGVGIVTWILLGILAAVDVKYNHAEALHGLGQLAASIIPQQGK